ncbi:glycoside hydrolase family protein [Pontiella sulfatireligans]|uniref:Beta-xylosidase C-terminal Concanavalin A-like domain-containing protein n=1 Tax=Pontiella sulfatireligans TaxID=2750658 RepID=A0A6C2UKV5_9BACT|nr:hypothetical protein [Pontiella sulfatireligans]VGO20599.1 hypothetical protein SCARR_02664 [Pontiella sulfatireligans]
MKAGLMRLFFWGLMGLFAGGSAWSVDNPLPVELDGSLVRYNGSFYAMSAQTNGQMLGSSNLQDWTSPVAVLPPEIGGPYDLAYRNGLFYLYAEGKGFAAGAEPLAPFSAIRKAGLSGEQMRLFQDKSGALFSVNRRLGSKKEGEIWLQRYASPWKTADRATELLDGRRGMWDSLDSADLGEPEILDYRGSYYLLYAANHPGPRTGLREIGVAMNENPRRFENPDKLADPVLARNVERLARTYAAVLPTAAYAPWKARYTTKRPDKNWAVPGSKLSGWRTGDGGFGFPAEVGEAQLFTCHTKWKENEIWVRREFDLPSGPLKMPLLQLRHEGAVQVFLNGKMVYESKEPSLSYSNFDISEAAAGAFKPDDNLLAVHAVAPKRADYRFLDFGLFDAGDEPVEPTVYGLDAPRIVTGPNGFEKWVAYRAWWNGQRGTGLDRVFFYNDEMVIDGPTTANTPGYHPPPAKPTFADSFASSGSAAWAERWSAAGGAWATTNGVMRQAETKGLARAYIKRPPAANYLFETSIRITSMEKGMRGAAGVVAWSDGKTDMLIGINPVTRTWEYHLEPGGGSPRRQSLPSAFQWSEAPKGIDAAAAPLHRLRITKNGAYFEVWLDEMLLTPGKPLITELHGAGVPGLFCSGAAAEFDGVVYTVGWDEHAEYITDWGSAADGTQPSGEWRHDKDDGLEQCRHSVPGLAFKGDLLDQYEFTVNLETEKLEEGKERLYGVFPVFANRDNYLKAVIDTRGRQLLVSGKLNGRDIGQIAKTLQRQIVHRHLFDDETAYRDIAAWVYQLRSQSVVSALDVRWLEGDFEHLRQEFFVPSDDMLIRYAKLDRGREPMLWDDGRFYDADEPKPYAQKPEIHNHIAIRPEIANNVGFGLYIPSSIVIDSRTGRYIRDYSPGEDLDNNEEIGSDTIDSDTMSRPQETVITVEVESSYFFRCIKLKDRVIIELNGQPMLTIKGEWPASQVGLLTEGQPCFFNGITLYHLPDE